MRLTTNMTTKPFKDKKGKLPFHLIPPEMDLAYAEVAEFGIQKLKNLGILNPERNWEAGLKLVEDHLAAAERHINKWKRNIDRDEESNLSHMKHALWHIVGIVTQIERGRTDLDDRTMKIVAEITTEDQLVALSDDPFIIDDKGKYRHRTNYLSELEAKKNVEAYNKKKLKEQKELKDPNA